MNINEERDKRSHRCRSHYDGRRGFEACRQLVVFKNIKTWCLTCPTEDSFMLQPNMMNNKKKDRTDDEQMVYLSVCSNIIKCQAQS